MRFLISSFFLLFTCSSFSQKLEAKYKIEQDIFLEDNLGNNKLVATMDYDGFLYKSGNRYIFFKKPLYLQKYPEGFLTLQNGGTSFHDIHLLMDTIQGLYYKDMDSLLFRYRADISGKDSVTNNFVQHFESGFQQWDLMPEMKEINGLKVQKAIFNYKGKLYWEAWFCADIPMQAGLASIIGLPGLVVEAICFATNERYSLLSYSSNGNFSDSVFWPNEFMQPFRTRTPIKKQVK